MKKEFFRAFMEASVDSAFDEFIFNAGDAKRLQKVVNFLKEESNDTGTKDKD